MAGEQRALAIASLVACSVVWGSNVVVGRAVHEEVPPLALAFWRNAMALLAVAPLVGAKLWRERRKARAQLRVLLLAGVLGTAVFNALVYTALQTTTAINAALTMSLAPAAIPALAFFVLRERLAPVQGIGILLSTLGVAWVVARGSLAVLADLDFVPGDVFMLGGMFCWSLYSVLVRLRPAGIDAATFFAWILIVAVVTLLPCAIAESLWVAAPRWSIPSIASVAYVGLFPTALALLVFNWAVAILGPTRAGSFQHLVPVAATGLAILLLGEELARHHVVGAVLVAAGLVLTNRSRASG